MRIRVFIGTIRFMRQIQELLVSVPDSPDAYETLVAEHLRSEEPNETLLFVGTLQSVPSSSQYLLTLAASTLKRAFSEASSKDPFGYALKKVNEAFRKEMTSGQNQWFGNFAAVAAVLNQDKIRLSCAGAAKIFITNDGNTEEIVATEGATQFFSAVAEGRLKANATLALLPAASMRLASPEELTDTTGRKIFTKNAHAAGGGAAIVIAPAMQGLRSANAEGAMWRAIPSDIIEKTSTAAKIFLRFPSAVSLGTIFGMIPVLLHAILMRFRKFLSLLGNRPRLAMVMAGSGAAIFVMIFVFFVLNKNSAPSLGASSLENVRMLRNDAEAALVLGNGERAHFLVEEGLSILNAIADSSEKIDLQEELSALALEIQGVKKVNLEIVTELPAFPVAFEQKSFAAFQTNDEGFVFFLSDPAYAGLWRLSQNTQRSGRFVFFPKPIATGVSAMTLLANGLFVAATDDGLVTLSMPQGTIRAVAAFNQKTKVSALFTDGKTIFGVDPTQKQLIEIGLSGKVNPILREAREEFAHVEGGVMVDNSYYLLLDDGTIARFRGKRALSTIVPKTKTGIVISARAITSNGRALFLLDTKNGRIARTNFDGVVEQQFENKALRDAKDFALLENGNAALVLTKSQIVKISLISE